jgi:hypothetical protein
MITVDDNGYGRLKRWRERHRGLVNLKQREYRKKKKGGDASCPVIVPDKISESTKSDARTVPLSNAAPTVQVPGAAIERHWEVDDYSQ